MEKQISNKYSVMNNIPIVHNPMDENENEHENVEHLFIWLIFNVPSNAVDTYRKIACVTISCGCRLRFQNRCASFLGNAKLPKWAYLPKRYMFIVLDSTPTPHMDRMYDANVAIFMVNQTEESFSCHMTIHWIFTKYK